MTNDTILSRKKDKAEFKPGTRTIVADQLPQKTITSPAQSEPPISRGIDLAGQPKIIFAAGRGKTGKTTLLRWVQEMSIARGGEAILADVDPTNATFSAYFEGVQCPQTNDPAGVTAWLSELIDHCIEHKQSAIIDLGGGDTTLRALATEMPELASVIEDAGLALVMLYLVGTQPEDLAPAVTLAAHGFTAKAQAFVFNEFAMPPGVSRNQAFARIITSEAYRNLSGSTINLWMPKLFAADVVESQQKSFGEIRDNKGLAPVGLLDRTRVRAWLKAMDARFEGVSSWIP